MTPEPPSECPHCGAAIDSRFDPVTDGTADYRCGTLLFRTSGGSRVSDQCHQRQLAAKDAEIESLRLKLLADDSDSIVASCNCLTKTPDAAHHKKGCKYRLITERDEARRQLQEARDKEKQARIDYGRTTLQ